MACQAEDVVDAVLLLAPAHQRLAGEAAVRPQQDAHARPALADPGHDARDLLQGAGAGIEVRAAQLGRASMAATEHVERQVAVKEPALLAAVDGIVRGSAIAHDLLGRPAVAIDEQLDQQTLDRARVMADLVVARRRRSWCVLLPANGAQSRRRAWSLPASSAMTGSCLSTAALSTVVIAQVLPAEGDAEHPLAQQRTDAVRHRSGRTLAGEAGDAAVDQADGAIRSTAPASEVIAPPSKAATT